MDKITQLWVRACKSENPQVRCESVLRRFYLANTSNKSFVHENIIYQLSKIIDEYVPMEAYEVYRSGVEDLCFITEDDRTQQELVRDAFINKIRFARVDTFKGLITRNKLKESM